MRSALTFDPDGTVHGLYTEAIDLSTLGRLHINRATHIEFDNALQAWRVRDPAGFPLFTAPTRQQCVAWEEQYFNQPR